MPDRAPILEYTTLHLIIVTELAYNFFLFKPVELFPIALCSIFFRIINTRASVCAIMFTLLFRFTWKLPSKRTFGTIGSTVSLALLVQAFPA